MGSVSLPVGFNFSLRVLKSKAARYPVALQAFWAGLFFFLISQLVDVQYFDGKISIVIWILIAGLKNIIEENNNDNKSLIY